MPRVPTYDNLQTTPSAGGTPAFQTPSGPSGEQVAAQQLQGLGEGAQRAGGAVSTIALDMARDANDLRVNDAMNQYVNAQTQARVEAMQLKGRNALERPDGKSLPDEFGERMQKQAEVISQTLANPAQRQAFAMNAGRMDGQFRASLSQHMVEQQNVYRKETQKGTLDTAVNQATLLWGDEKLRAQSVATVTKVVYAIARDNGMPPEARDPAYRDEPLAKARGTFLFQNQVRFATLSTTPLTQTNALAQYHLALELLHFSPEHRVIERVIDSAMLLGLDAEAVFHMQRFKAAFPEDFDEWVAARRKVSAG